MLALTRTTIITTRGIGSTPAGVATGQDAETGANRIQAKATLTILAACNVAGAIARSRVQSVWLMVLAE